MIYLVGFLLTIGILVTIHEWGHFFVARLCGVGVLRFSIGFGPILWRRTDRRGTEWALSLLPLGGYVKMIDEREAPVSDDQLSLAFNRKSVAKRAAIVAAGPLVNLLFAFLLFIGLHIVGIKDIRPILGEPQKNTPAHIAGIVGGEEIIAINNYPVKGWSDIREAIIDSGINSAALSLLLQSPDGDKRTVKINTGGVLHYPPTDIGLYPPRPNPPAIVYAVIDDSPAKRAGILVGDEITAIGNTPTPDWFTMLEAVHSYPAQRINIEINRKGEVLTLSTITDENTLSDGKKVGVLGIRLHPNALKISDEYLFRYALPAIPAVAKAADKTVGTAMTILRFIGGIFRGEVSWRFLNGPLAIAEVSGRALEDGLNSFVQLVTAVSISLGVMNLLPLPVLDGGHLVLLAYEAITRKAPSMKVIEWLTRVGASLLIMLMVLALYNDIINLIR